jgi:predicted membrane protein
MGIGSQYHSISHSGTALFARPLHAVVGSIVVDLASAPLPPGEHRLEVATGIGSVKIYMPRHAKFTVEAGSVLGSHSVHEGFPLWDRLFGKIKVAPAPESDAPSLIRIVAVGGVGSLEIYRV